MCSNYFNCKKKKNPNNLKDIVYYDGIESTNYTSKNRLILNHGSSIDNRYEILNGLGRGAFSDVYLCKDHKENCYNALKVIRKEQKFHNCAFKEYKLYEKINNQENCINIINLQRYFIFNSNVFFSFEVHGISLYEYYINTNNTIDIKNFSKQILNGIVYLHNINIIHADLKPENILIKDNILKIIDLGSSFIEKSNCFNDYIQSRWYRAPEILFNNIVTRKIDVWSYGCIIYELYYRKPLHNGKTSSDMRDMILNVNRKIILLNYMFIPDDEQLNLVISLCLKFKQDERINSHELIKTSYFNY